MEHLRGKKIIGLCLLISGALYLAHASAAFAATKDDLKKSAPLPTPSKVIGSSNAITAKVDAITGYSSSPGFLSVQSLNSGNQARAMSSWSPVLQSTAAPLVAVPSAGTIPTNSVYSRAGVVPAASAPVIQTVPAVWASKPIVTSNTPALSSSVISSNIQANIVPAASGAAVQPQANIGLVVKTSESPGMRNDFDRTVSCKDSVHAMNESTAQGFVKNKAGTQEHKITKSSNPNVNVLVSQVKQTAAGARLLAKQAHRLSAKTASSVMDGFYVVKSSLSKAKTTALNHIKFAHSLKKRTYENTSGWIKGIIPIFKFVIQGEELPLLMDLLFLDRNTLPAAGAVDRQKDPLSPPVRKTMADSNSGNPSPLSADISCSSSGHINPIHTICSIDIIKKTAVNYNKTGLSPPQTVSTNSTALLSASNRFIRNFSARLFSIRHTNFIINNSIPLSLLISGGDQSKGRGIFLFNNLLTGGAS